MLKENKDPTKVEETFQNDFYVGVVERPNVLGITEDKIHQRLGDIHKNRPKRLTDEEKEILKKWKEWNLKDLPEDWQSKYQSLIKSSEELGQWKKYFGELKPLEVKSEYDKPKEIHSQEQINELSKIPQLEQDKRDYVSWQTDLKQFLTKYGVGTLFDLGSYIETLKNSAQLSEEEKQAIKDYADVKKERDSWNQLFPNKTVEEVKKQVGDDLKELNDWHATFTNKNPQEVLNQLNATPTTINTPLTEEEQQKINNYDGLLRERDKLVLKLKQKELEAPTQLSKKIGEEILNAYKSAPHLYTYYLKLMKQFKDWEIFGTEPQQLASKQNDKELIKIINFLTKQQ